MTNRRKGSKTKASLSKKSESPDKQSRRLSRRSRRTRKSDSVEEQPEEIGSEYSVDENTEDETRGYENERDVEDTSQRETDQYEGGGKSLEDQKLLIKEEESGGSDGSWKVKSENGGSGGIPKLKLCLTRPPDVSSPTSEQPSPRRRRRGRGNASPAPQELQEALREDKESPKRSTRSQKAKEMAEQEMRIEIEQVEVLQLEEKETVRSEVCDSTNINHSENEYETQMAVDSIMVSNKQDETEENLQQQEISTIQCAKERKEIKQQEKANVVERDREKDGSEKKDEKEKEEEKALERENEEKEREREKERQKEREKEEKERQKEREKEEKERQKEKEKEEKERQKEREKEEKERQKEKEKEEKERQKEKEKEEKERQKEREKEEKERQKEKEKEEKEKERERQREREKEKELEKKQEEMKMEVDEEREKKKEKEKKSESESVFDQNDTTDGTSAAAAIKDKPIDVEEIVEIPASEIERSTENERHMEVEKRCPSRDSSEERAKEEALRSRNKYKKVEDSGGKAVVESSMVERRKEAPRTEESEKSQIPETRSDTKENQEELAPTKANNRKRRWGASSSRVTKKPPVSISTDFLKEIIPEVKPLPMSEVQLSPNEEYEDSQVKDREDNLSIPTKKIEREKMVQSDESEKDYEEEAVESGAEESPKNESVKALPQLKEKEFNIFTRKVSVLPSNDLNKLQRSPSPPRNKPSNILYIVNLVRPFTIPQLRELLARTGTIAEDGFWIDKIKSRCYVKYETEEEAKTTRHALHGVRWPVSNPKQLNVDFGTEAAMKSAQEGNEILPERSIPSLFDKSMDAKGNEKAREREDRNREKKDRIEKDKKEIPTKHREDENREEEDKDKKTGPPVKPLVRERPIRRVTVRVREWDVGKNVDGFPPPNDGIEFGRHRDDRYERRVDYDRDKRDDYDERRRRDKDRGRRSVSNEPPRKSKKKNEEEAPAKLLDDLFRKTKATPCIYWLPLTAEQISVKEELRRKHMAEHEKRVAELRKIQREQNKRSSDKRRRRTKSRSRSRSPKK